MGRLVPFNRDLDRGRGRREPLPEPPADPLERASWVHDLLCRELYDVVHDPTIKPPEKRALVARLSGKITQATPNHEIAAAREALQAAEAEQDGRRKLAGEVKQRAKASGARPLHAAAPRGRT